MKKLPVVLLVWGWAMALAAQPARMQAVVEAAGEPLAFANVQLEGPQVLRGASTDEAGRFRLHGLPAGAYLLRVSRLGYVAYRDSLKLRPGEIRRLTIELMEDRLDLEEVVVSATRYALQRQDNPVVVHTLGRRLFQATQSMALSDGLAYQPGVRVETNCQNCGFTQVRLNGLQGAYSQILINSRPVFSALNSVYGLDQIPTNMVERVEVVRSGGSALYGSNAIAGTINIITRDPVLNRWEVGSSLALIDGRIPDQVVNANASLVDNELRKGISLYGMLRNRQAFDANDDGFSEITRLESGTLGAKAFWKPGEDSKLTLDLSGIQEYRRGGDRLDLPPHLTDIAEELTHQTLIGGLAYELSKPEQQYALSAYTSFQRTQRDSYYGGLGGGRTAADSLTARQAYGNTDDLAWVSGLQYSLGLGGDSRLVAGAEHRLNEVRDDIPGYRRLVDQQVRSLGLYAQLEWALTPRLRTLLGLRYDHTRVDGRYEVGDIQRRSDVRLGVFSPRFTLLYELSEALRFRGGYARGFRAPQAFNEDLHISSVGGEPLFVVLGEGLDKELSDAFTVSADYARALGSVQFNLLLEGFYTLLHNPFTLVSTGSVLPNGSILEEVRNGAGAQVAGINGELRVSPSRAWLLQAGGTFQRSRYREPQILFDDGNADRVATRAFTRTPDLYGYLAANWSPGKRWSFDLTGTYTGSMIVPRVVDASGLLDLVDSDPFLDMNLKASHHFDLMEGVHLEANIGVQNIFNSYQDDFDAGPRRDSDYIYGPARPRTLVLGLKIGNLH